ncbi:gamma-glutamyl phosphate reductase [Streptococcus pneumoniae]|nr:gamma-glutamyl phosphate reductase [Streptococcus pneumoniae]
MVSRQEQFEQVQAVKKSINTASEEVKNQVLLAMADHLVAATEEILAANALDMAAAKGKISDVMLDRLYLDADRIEAMARGIREVVALPDPIGEVLETSQLENGLVITKKRVAMGVIGIIYESRPNVTSDAAALTLKSGNAVVLRSGKDCLSNNPCHCHSLEEGLGDDYYSSKCDSTGGGY